MNEKPSQPETTSHSLPELQTLFNVKPVGKGWRQAIPRRIQSIRPFKDISNFDANWMKEQAYEHAGLQEYMRCWTGEMESRPIPFVSTDRKPLLAKQLFEKYIDHVMAFLLPQIKPHVQTINKISSLGDPIFCNPGTGIDEKDGIKKWQSKFDVVLEEFEPMVHGDFSKYEKAIHTIGCRKQNEPPSKEREFQFINTEGIIYAKTITAKEREITVPDLGVMIGSRTRTITRPPVVNLWLQCWDSMLHNAIMQHPVCDSNIYTKQHWDSDSNFATFDCKHYERFLGLAAISYAHTMGGEYERQLLNMIYMPFIVPSDDWSCFFEIAPQYREGVYPQFSSGLSPVAPLGKLTNLTVQTAYFVEHKGMDVRSAVATVFSGISPGLRRWCYGDDNRLLGDQQEIDSFTKFMGDIFDIELDEQPRFLGALYRAELGEWLLPRDTYNLKLYQPERDYDWKDYPHLGMVERRAVFSKYGEPEISALIIPFENDLWNAIDYPYQKIVYDSVVERMKATAKGVKLTKEQVTDKSYLMTEPEKIASGQFWHLEAPVTAMIVNALVGPNIRGQLTFKDASTVPLPMPDRRAESFVQNTDAITKQDDIENIYATETV